MQVRVLLEPQALKVAKSLRICIIAIPFYCQPHTLMYILIRDYPESGNLQNRSKITL